MRTRVRASLAPLIGFVTASVFLLGASMPVSAQGLGAQGGAPEMAAAHLQMETYGSAQTVHTVAIGHIDKPSNAITWSTSVSGTTGIGIFQTSTSTTDWWHGVYLPNGSIVDRIELEACDTTTTGEALFGMARGAAPAGAAANVTPVGTTGLAATPGCAFFSVTPTATLTIDNRNNNYWLFLDYSGAGAFAGAIRANAFRIFFHLQVSPAPATATFPGDVPTSHPFFRFIEAMAASGLTGGCGAGIYCPDSPVTRGQMAVFLSVALGLHFPN